MNQVGIALVWCGLQVTVLSSVAAVACVGMRRSNPALRAWTVLLALFAIPCLTALALCPLPSWFDGRTNGAVANASSEASRYSAAPDANATASDTVAETIGAFSGDETDIQLADLATAFMDELTLRSQAEALRSESSWPAWLVWVLVAFGGMGLVHLAIGWLATHAYRSRGAEVDDREMDELLDVVRAKLNCRCRVNLLEVNGLTGAATLGFFRPVILLPKGWRAWTSEECRVVLAHEVAHVAHRDYLTGFAAQSCLAVHFYHPLVHWLVARLRLDQELLADAAAAAIAGGQRNYLTTLAEMALRQDDRAVPFPARMFLPTRRSFLRRIEMLRTWKVLPAGLSTRARSVAVVILLAVVAVIAGLRSPIGSNLVLAQAAESDSRAVASAPAFDTRYVAEDGGVIFAIRPARMLRHASLNDVRKLLDDFILKNAEELGFHPADIDQVIASSNVVLQSSDETEFYVRGTKPIDYSRLIKNMTGMPLAQLAPLKHGGATLYRVPHGMPSEQRAFWMPDDCTLVFATVRHLRRFIDGNPASQLLLKSDAWKSMNDRDVVLLADQDSLQMFVEHTSAGLASTLVRPLIDKTRLLGVSLEVEDELRIVADVSSRNADDAGVVAETLNAARVLARNMLQQMAKDGEAAGAGPNTSPEQSSRNVVKAAAVVQKLVQLCTSSLTAMKIEQKDNSTRVTTTAKIDDLQLAVFAPAISAAHAAAKRAESMNNLKQIGLAFHNYHDTYKHFPGASAVPEGKQHPVSWRVALLPFIEQHQLYEQYNFEEPWDSENNRKLIAKMPSVYRHPTAPANSTSPSYFVLTGPDTVFRNDTPQFRDIHDGTSNTILAVEAQQDTPWTKPEDIPFNKDKAIPEFGGYNPNVFNAVFADGAVKPISDEIDEATLRLLIMSQDGQPVPR
jgi:beta-lactamase regulating signal transducer with metallopeptidase domain